MSKLELLKNELKEKEVEYKKYLQAKEEYKKALHNLNNPFKEKWMNKMYKLLKQNCYVNFYTLNDKPLYPDIKDDYIQDIEIDDDLTKIIIKVDNNEIIISNDLDFKKYSKEYGYHYFEVEDFVISISYCED